MKIYSIQPKTNQTSFHAGVRIKGSDNLKHNFLYNEIIKLTNDFKIPANYKTEEIVLPSVSKDILKKLKELKIIFSNI